MRKQVAQLVLIATVSVFSLAAQGGGRLQHGSGGGLLGGSQTSADAIARRVEYLTALLTLTPTQATQASTILTTAAGTIAPLETNLDTARTSLRAGVQSNSTAQIDQLSTQIGTLTGQILAAQNRAEAAFYALLTADQRTRYDAVGSRGAGRGGRGH